MKWSLGLDLTPSSTGALQFCRWLADTSRAEETFRASFVLEQRRAEQLMHASDLIELRRQAEHAMQRTIEGAELGELVPVRQVLSGADADKALGTDCEAHETDAIVIGRRAATDTHRIVRLGRVARRLLRTLPRPVVVVPPELAASEVGKGPVLLASSLGTDSDGAAHFARALAEALDRPLVAVHVFAPAAALTTRLAAPGMLRQIETDALADARRDVERWLHKHGTPDVQAIVAAGDPVERLIGIARAEASPLVVVGSRLLGLAPRVLRSSVGSELAAAAPCPVVVVPPPATVAAA